MENMANFNDIAVIVPLHKIDENNDKKYMDDSYNSVVECRKFYNGSLDLVYVVAPEVETYIKSFLEGKVGCNYIVNTTGETDFCSQINFAVDNIDEKYQYFSILEYDDVYRPKWFKMASDYYRTNEQVSIFLPVNIIHSSDDERWQYGNELPLAGSFSNNLGFIDNECLETYFNVNLTGGIFNREDFVSAGKYKPSIKVAFNYELLLRMTKKEYKVMVVPKEGYVHMIGREGCLNMIYMQTIPDKDVKKWFELAKRESKFDEDRKKAISSKESEDLK